MTPEKDGTAYRDILEGLLSRTNDPQRREKLIQELHVPLCPKGAGYIFEIYNRLRRRKGSNGFGLGPIEWQDIDAFARVSGARMSPWDVRVIESLDDIFLTARAGKEES